MSENKKLLDTITNINNKDGRLARERLNPKWLANRKNPFIISRTGNNSSSARKLDSNKSINFNTLKRQISNNKKIRDNIHQNRVETQNVNMLGRIQSARSIYSCDYFKKKDRQVNEYRKNIQPKYQFDELKVGTVSS